jgi:hypothetical protein
MHKKLSSKDELAHLAMQIKRDNAKFSSAEKRFKITGSFEKAVQKMGQTPPPKKKVK